MANKKLIQKYLDNMTEDSGIALARSYGVVFTREEAHFILSFLKKHADELDMENKDRLLSLARKQVSRATYDKIEKLLMKTLPR